MSVKNCELENGPSLATVWPVFAKIALAPFLSGVAVLAYTAAWASEGDSGWLTAVAGLLISIAVVTLFTPLLFLLVFYSIVSLFWLGLLVFLDDVPWVGWPRRVRTILRSSSILACIAGIAFTIPQLFMAPTWKAFKDTALTGVVFPASTVLCLFMSRFEGIGKGLAKADGQEIRQF